MCVKLREPLQRTSSLLPARPASPVPVGSLGGGGVCPAAGWGQLTAAGLEAGHLQLWGRNELLGASRYTAARSLPGGGRGLAFRGKDTDLSVLLEDAFW